MIVSRQVDCYIDPKELDMGFFCTFWVQDPNDGYKVLRCKNYNRPSVHSILRLSRVIRTRETRIWPAGTIFGWSARWTEER